MENNSRRHAIRNIAGSLVLAASLPAFSKEAKDGKPNTKIMLKGNIHHSVCRWCYDSTPFEELCKAAKAMGIKSIDLTGPEEWPMMKKYGLHCAMPWGAGMGIEKGFNDVANHAELFKSYEAHIPKVAAAGFDKLICFSGNRKSISDEQGLENCASGLKMLMPVAEKYKVTLVMELLNSKVDHHDYMADHTAWGAALCDKLGSEYFKLLYDIYHMQIMEGDIIATINKYHKHIVHYHTGGVPGRNEIDERQEIFYPAVMRAILATGFKGYVAQEFIPKDVKPLESLRKSIAICDI